MKKSTEGNYLFSLVDFFILGLITNLTVPVRNKKQ